MQIISDGSLLNVSKTVKKKLDVGNKSDLGIKSCFMNPALNNR